MQVRPPRTIPGMNLDELGLDLRTPTGRLSARGSSETVVRGPPRCIVTRRHAEMGNQR